MRKDLPRVVKVLIDTSTFFDVWNAPKHLESVWAQNTLANLLLYQVAHPTLTVSSFTVFEHLDGLYRQRREVEAAEFVANVVPTLEVIYPDLQINDLASKIHAALRVNGKIIGIGDIFIAASAITANCPLVNANTKHFERIRGLGFPLTIENWRDA